MQKRQYNYHKLERCTNGFVKKPSVRTKLKNLRKMHKQWASEIADYDDRYTVIDENGEVHNYIEKASEKQFGIFNKKGYRAIKLYSTKEEAECELSTWKRPDFYEVREIEWFEEDKEK